MECSRIKVWNDREFRKVNIMIKQGVRMDRQTVSVVQKKGCEEE